MTNNYPFFQKIAVTITVFLTCIFALQAAPTNLDLPPLADTVRISVAVLQPKDTCLSSLIGMGRTITSLNACQTSSRHVRLTAQSADCIRLTAISTTAGSQDTLCIQHCNRNGTDCGTFVLIAQVAGGTLGCDIAPDTLVRVQLPDCQGRARFCIHGSNILDEFRRNYTITHNGSPYNGFLEGCSFDTIYSYTYFTIPGSFQQPPYRLDGWMFNGRNYQFDFHLSRFDESMGSAQSLDVGYRIVSDCRRLSRQCGHVW
jgi:hypothetical protein